MILFFMSITLLRQTELKGLQGLEDNYNPIIPHMLIEGFKKKF